MQKMNLQMLSYTYYMVWMDIAIYVIGRYLSVFLQSCTRNTYLLSLVNSVGSFIPAELKVAIHRNLEKLVSKCLLSSSQRLNTLS